MGATRAEGCAVIVWYVYSLDSFPNHRYIWQRHLLAARHGNNDSCALAYHLHPFTSISQPGGNEPFHLSH